MHILILCKRQYTGKDLLNDRYGRLFELPVALADLGHTVSVVTTSYRKRGAEQYVDRGVRWRSVDALPTPLNVIRIQAAEAKALRPDLVWASSDAHPFITRG